MIDKSPKAKGKLPCKSWLIRNGYKDIVEFMKTHSEMFAHIEQENKRGKNEQKTKR